MPNHTSFDVSCRLPAAAGYLLAALHWALDTPLADRLHGLHGLHGLNIHGLGVLLAQRLGVLLGLHALGVLAPVLQVADQD